MKELFEKINYRFWWVFGVYLPYQFNVFVNYISVKNRMIHGGMKYKCNKCGKIIYMKLEVGVEGKSREVNLMPCPFMIKCPCGGDSEHTDWHEDFFLSSPLPLEKYMSFFMLDRIGLKKKNPRAHGIPIISKWDKDRWTTQEK
jgi:hypothetical protein